MVDEPAHTVFRDRNTLVLVDGVPIPEDSIFNYDPLKVKQLQIDYDGLQYHRQFYSPAYPTIRRMQSRRPDFRNVLYWNPDLRVGQTSSQIEFYTSDLPGDYLIVIQDLSSDGRAGVACLRFTVHPPGH